MIFLFNREVLPLIMSNFLSQYIISLERELVFWQEIFLIPINIKCTRVHNYQVTFCEKTKNFIEK